MQRGLRVSSRRWARQGTQARRLSLRPGLAVVLVSVSWRSLILSFVALPVPSCIRCSFLLAVQIAFRVTRSTQATASLRVRGLCKSP
jgi:hypothetical protein